jgi:hypothetical protein
MPEPAVISADVIVGTRKAHHGRAPQGLPENPGRIKTKPLRGRLRRVLTQPRTSSRNKPAQPRRANHHPLDTKRDRMSWPGRPGQRPGNGEGDAPVRGHPWPAEARRPCGPGLRKLSDRRTGLTVPRPTEMGCGPGPASSPGCPIEARAGRRAALSAASRHRLSCLRAQARRSRPASGTSSSKRVP